MHMPVVRTLICANVVTRWLARDWRWETQTEITVLSNRELFTSIGSYMSNKFQVLKPQQATYFNSVVPKLWGRKENVLIFERKERTPFLWQSGPINNHFFSDKYLCNLGSIFHCNFSYLLSHTESNWDVNTITHVSWSYFFALFSLACWILGLALVLWFLNPKLSFIPLCALSCIYFTDPVKFKGNVW